MANERKTVMVSSTARDLPEHRKEVMDACLRQGMFPDMMEHLPASDADAIRVSLDMVDRADIYLGIFAHRYGYVPKEGNPKQISITEMEYNRAVERNIPRLIFIMHEDHQLKAADVETGEGAEKLKKFKDRIGTDRVAGFFKSPVDLRAQIIQALVPYRESDITQFHYVSDIPQPPEAYIAHPYTLLQTHRLIGRQNELNLLTNWVTKKQDEIYWSRILSIVAIGGMGKSALTWKWFNDIAPQEMKLLAGRMWWSFYESDATFENFVIRALAYVSKRSREDIEKNTRPGEREEQLLQILDREPYLLILDGLERILIAYARMDASRLSDDDLDQKAANYVAKAYGLPESAAQSFVGQHLLRKTTDPRAGSFLRKLGNVRSSRILVSTRLYPSDLQSVTGEPVTGCAAIFLRGLNDNDALDLWRAFHVSGSRETLLPLFNKFENHPLLMQSLASEVANYRRAPGDFERWQRDHPKFEPFSLPLTEVKGHVLGFALRGLYKNARKVLEIIAGFRMPAHYDTLAAILVGEGKIIPTELGLDQALKELEDRGLLGWDKRANRYDLHPIVRGTVWNGLSNDSRHAVFSSLETHFESSPEIDQDKVNNLEDLTTAIELYNTLIGMGRYDDAYIVWMDRLEGITLYRLNVSRQRAELLEMLFPDGMNKLPRISKPHHQSVALNALALAYDLSGQPGRAAPLFQLSNDISEKQGSKIDLSISLNNLSETLGSQGSLQESEACACRALVTAREQSDHFHTALSLESLGKMLAIQGIENSSGIYLHKAIKIHRAIKSTSERVWSFLSQRALWLNRMADAQRLAYQAEQTARIIHHELSFVRAARLQGMASLGLGDLAKAHEHLYHALTRSRAINLVEEEIQILVALADLRRGQKDFKLGRELLDNMWEYAERGPYPLFHADAFNVLAQIERDEGNKDKAIEAATKAYRLAWCDGPPYAYHWGLEKAKGHLKELGVPEPEMPPFDESKYEPMPEVEINPKDEFWVDPDNEFDIDDLEK
ncbi:MAG TPA: DUF4062 domain-containing protein [Anaerolineales bacterium]|nr:DUF4062 domain-containing protein [Anaerolineales bacterium]